MKENFHVLCIFVKYSMTNKFGRQKVTFYFKSKVQNTWIKISITTKHFGFNTNVYVHMYICTDVILILLLTSLSYE